MRLKRGIELLLRHGSPFLVLGAAPDALTKEIRRTLEELGRAGIGSLYANGLSDKATAKDGKAQLRVHQFDLSGGLQDRRKLTQRLRTEPGDTYGIVHIAVGPYVYQEVNEAVIGLAIDKLVPHWDRLGPFRHGLILSSTAASLGELPEIFQQTFDIVLPDEHNSPYVPPSFKQAVVFFHGIGEQIVTESAERFASAVLPENKFYLRADDLSMQGRKLVANVLPHLVGHGAAILTPRNTDFYEYYWADKPADTKRTDSLVWLAILLRKRPTRKLAPFWVLSWMSIIAFAAAVYANMFLWQRPSNLLITLLSGGVSFVLNWLLVRYVGDAARYFHPSPRNYMLREQLIGKGVELLTRLSQPGLYDRIIIVGHSLGSVIAYDVLRTLWFRDFWQVYSTPRPGQPALEEMERAGHALKMEATDQMIIDYQEKQIALWREMKTLGSPWKVSDFITMGSPLAHAQFLLHGEFETKIAQGELPTNPPAPSGFTIDGAPVYALPAARDYGFGYPVRLIFADKLFAFTRWTNLYFPAHFSFFGDIIGGPLRPSFGPGIRDRAVTSRNLLRQYTPIAHVSYLSDTPKSEMLRESRVAIDALIEALDLNAERLGILRTEVYGRNTELG